MGLEVMAIPLALSLLCWSTLALILHGVVLLIASVSSLKKYTAKQMFIALFVSASTGVSTGVKNAARLAVGVARWWLLFLVVFAFFSTLYVTYTELPETWLAFAEIYNGSVGPLVHLVLTLPLRVVDLLLRALIPIWNTSIWVLKALVTQGLLPVLVKDVETVVKMATSLVSLATHLALAFAEFFESFLCEGMACLHPEKGVMDLITSMGDVRELALLGTQLLRDFCSTLAAPLDVLVYPLTDFNFAEGLHNLANAVFQLIVVIPRNTVTRCLEKEDNQFSILMCTPDTAPFFNMLAAGLSSLGLAVDNWLNIVFVIVETVIGGNPPQCATADNSIIPDVLAENGVFKAGTVVVGLTDWLYAVTDGMTALYMGHNDGTQTKIQTWPFAVDTGLGVAAVTYSGVHDLDVSAFSSGKTSGSMQTTAMMGCNCSDTAGGLQVLCAILPISGIPSEAAKDDYRIQVQFSDASASGLYTCAGVDLYVKSVRWSYTRYESKTVTLGSTGQASTLPTHDCIARGTCRELDATIWLIPRCGQDRALNAEKACISSAPCFPFCMAARSAGSGRVNLVFVRAARWREGATILGQDCAIQSSTPDTIQLGIPRTGRASGAGTTQQSLLQTGGTAVFGISATTQACTPALGVTSMVPKNRTAITAAGPRVAYNVVLGGQPFAVTGDTLFTTVPLGGWVDSVQVERLEGDEVDVFSLNSINQQLPSHAKAVVPLAQVDLDSTERLTIPYSYQTNRVAATNSRNFVFYASSPNADVLAPYLEYCKDRTNPSKQSKFGLVFTSSYSKVRVYRVSAYRRCAAYSCGDDLIRFATFDGFSMQFGRACDGRFNMSITALEYLNEDNVAVTVMSSGVDTWDAETGEFGGATTKTYWLNPATMRVKDTVWQTDPASSGIPTEIPSLCPALQRLPRVGSFAAELANAGVFLVQFVTNCIAYTPGLVAVWSEGPRCPAPGSALYHSVLANCGERVYSLDNFFDSLDDAGAIFWHSLSLIARLIAPEGDTLTSSPIVEVLDGMSNYGQGAVDIWAAGAGVLTLTRVPIKEQGLQLWATLQAGTMGDAAKMIQGLSAPAAGMLAWSRYTYRVVSVVTIDLLKRVLDPLVDVTLKDVFTLFWADVYDLQEEFAATVTARSRLACAGIKLMFGVDNPWANLLYHQCAASVELTGDLMTLVLNIFVQIPMAKCVCKDVSSQSVVSVVVQKCAPPLPVSLVPTLYTIANELIGTVPVRSMACERVLETVTAAIDGSMDSWFEHQFLALDALGSSVDYAIATFDSAAGQCLNFQDDPHVVVIVPEPVDYFYRCGGTSMCKKACSAEWKAFQAAVALSRVTTPEMTSLSVTIESFFFPGELDEDLTLTNVSASVELPVNSGLCLVRAGDQQDFVLAVAEVSGQAVTMQVWCAPQIPTSPVYRSDAAGYGPYEVPGAMLDLQFGDGTGDWLAALTQLAGGGEGVYILNGTGIFALPVIEKSILGESILLRIQNLWLIEGLVLIDVMARQLKVSTDPTTDRLIAQSEPVSLHFTLSPVLGTGLPGYGRWQTSETDLVQFGLNGYWYTRPYGWPDYLFLPKNAGRLPFRVQFARVGQGLQLVSKTALKAVSLPAMSDASLSVRGQQAGVVFVTSRTGWDWLKQARFDTDGYVAGVFGSSEVKYTISIKGTCDERGCDGCGSMQIQRLCLSYSKCSLVNCVGTPVHQRRPLCGIGALLRQTGRMGLLSTQGAWAIFTEMLGLTMQLSLLDLKEVYLLWPEDEFLGYMCQAKDTSAEFFSILTATVNSALQMGSADIGYMYGGASNVDTNADAMLTISSTALNAFMHQLFLFPLYGLAVSHQIMMCQISGIIALVPTSDFRLTLQSARDTPATDLLAGQCLTVGAEVLASYPTDDSAALATSITTLISNALLRLLITQIEPAIHIMDAFLAYWTGVVKALAGLVQAQNLARCSPPDFFLKDVVKCACGDQALQIPDARRNEGLASSPLWCTGVLGMVDSNNQPYYVHNPYTYAQIQAMSAGLEAYLACVGKATAYNCVPPANAFFDGQGVTVFNVLIKCKDNFKKKRWDPAAFMLYQPKYWDLVDFQGVPVIPSRVLYNVRRCLTDGDAATGSLAQYCHEQFLNDSQTSSETYWQYERLTRTGPEFTDACLAFSGPAEVLGLPEFKACVDGLGSGAACALPAHMWTPRSDNRIPPAEQHRVVSHGVNRDGLVQTLYDQARSKVMTAIGAALAVWNAGGTQEVNVEFFSVEGDVLHQTMDCIFMGPYSRVDYWPTPPCLPGEECLRGPFWSRDEGEGLQRQVDPATCTAPARLPFTCGSPSRKALMRYLVLELLSSSGGEPNQNGSNVAAILRSTLSDLALLWGNTTGYGCDCGANPPSPSCCATNLTAPLLPERLVREYTKISAQTVLNALEDDMAALYDLALEKRAPWVEHLQDVAPGEDQEYNWNGSQRAADEARFNPKRPTSGYSSDNEPLSPLQSESSTLWDVCHASLKQVLFTLPLNASGEARFSIDEFDGDPARLEEYVRAFTEEAFQHSPLFRHYSPRHAPSQSHMCRGPHDETADAGSLVYSDFVQHDTVMISGRALADEGPVFHPHQFRVGAENCLCGWARQNTTCTPPTERNTHNDLCDRLGRCSRIKTYDTKDHEAVVALFSPDWYCPEIELSPHWGYLDPSANEDWLGRNRTNLTTSARDLFRHGRAGLRPGNVKSLGGLAKVYVNPKTRITPLEHGRLTTCDPPPPPEDLLAPFIDGLFPAAHGVDEAGATAYCLRYAIELARWTVLRLLDQPDGQAAIVAQREVAERWRIRCGTQLHLLFLCVSLGVFRPLADPVSRALTVCPHFTVAPDLAREVYVTPECLVSVDGLFYDPCRSPTVDCASGASHTLALSSVLAGSGLRFDPRDMLRWGAPIGWIDGLHPLPDPEASLLHPGFTEGMLSDPDAVGNVLEGEPWWLAEGPMAENSEFCDTVMDWWPEDWDFPVGYHVTVPCEADDTAYRSFSQAFGFDEAAHTLVYQHDLLRDADLVDSHFGVAGLCRAGTFGMPMPETNNMRYCTQIPLDDTEDFTLPLRDGADSTDTDAWTDWGCTTSSAQLPWPDEGSNPGAHQSARFSIGTLPNMPIETSPTYPASEADMFDVGPWQEIQQAGDSWGSSPDTRCQDFRILLCHASSCPAGFACRGMVCTGDYVTVCTDDANCTRNGLCRGVCLEGTVECIKHADCPDEKMCSGVGTCQTPVLAVQNRLQRVGGDSISLSLSVNGTSCGAGARNYSLLRASYWGNTGQDLLKAHGMCSFEDWFKYTRVYSQAGCSSIQDNETLLLDPSRCTLVDLEQIASNQTKWWPQGNLRPDMMYVRPTICDRDYERLEGYTQCAPESGFATILTANDARDTMEYDRFVRLHGSETSQAIELARMPGADKLGTGFLGLGSELGALGDLAANPFVACGMVGQCYPPRFTVRGNTTNRTHSSPQGWIRYSDANTFTCGGFGIQTSAGCTIDVDRFPLYRALCSTGLAVDSCRGLAQVRIDRICSATPLDYEATNQDRTATLDGLRELFYAFPVFTTLDEYLDVTACATDLHAALEAYQTRAPGQLSTSLYFPFMYSLYEIPFDWYFQCVMLGETTVKTGARGIQNCRPYDNQADPNAYTTVSSAGDSFQTYLQYVRAGYTRPVIEAYIEAHDQVNLARLEQVRTAVVQEMFLGSTDYSYPRCSKNLLWKVGKHGDAYSAEEPYSSERRAVLWNWYDEGSCKANWHELLLDRLEATGVSRTDWITTMTDPDPVNLVRQDGAGADTLVGTAVDFIGTALGIETVQTVYYQTQGVIRYNNTPPSVFDLPLPASLRPAPSANQGKAEDDERVNRTCVFLPSFDPAFSSFNTAGAGCGEPSVETANGRTDFVRTCQHTRCSTIPMLYRRDGKFSCRYVASAVIDSLCTEVSSGCEARIMGQVYKRIVQRFTSSGWEYPQTLPPTVFPWYQARGWDFPALDLTETLDYERNIQPNPERAVMCEINTDEAGGVRFTDCTNPHYLTLQKHVDRNYKHDGGVVIPAGAQLEWPLERGVLAKGVILSFANTNRPIRQRFMDALFDNMTVCKGDNSQHVCRKRASAGQSFNTMNPWTLGNFNPYEVCDVEFTSKGTGSREFISTYCPEKEGALCKEYLAQSPTGCKDRHRTLVLHLGVPRFLDELGTYDDYNLCHHTNLEDDDGCMNDQGLLGGYDGLMVGSPKDSSYPMTYGTKYEAETYQVASNLYEKSRWSIPADFRTGMFAGTNPLWQGEEAQYGHLQVDPNEIGGHRIGVVVLRVNESIDNISTMLVERLPLGTQGAGTLMDEPGSHGEPVQDWVPDLMRAMRQEGYEVDRMYQITFNASSLAASCPLQRWAFYSGSYARFSPRIPSPKRAQHLFHRIHKGLLSHPTMRASNQGAFLGKYKTPNGFCACPVLTSTPQVQCLVPIDENSPCSMRGTIRSLMGENDDYQQSYVFPSISPSKAARFCDMQLDWPKVDGGLRDSTAIQGDWVKASDPAAKSCHLLDRFKPFRYKYRADTVLKSTTMNTIRNGACATSRVATLQNGTTPSQYARCLRDGLYESSVYIKCNTSTGTYTLPRRGRLSLAEVVARRSLRRARCSQCSPPPRFLSQQGRPLPPESSFGRLHRLSPERLLAKDLREAICPAGRVCPTLNESAWRRGVFMQTFMLHPERLFLNATKWSREAPAPVPEDPAVWTAKPWVYCPTSGALRSGENCMGTITRDKWLASKTKLCPEMVRSFSTASTNGSDGDPMARTPFCSIDKTTEAVCLAISEAKQLVIQANCIARGDPECMPSPFVYQPASFEPSNNAWVHDTVKAYYKRINTAACPQNTSTDQALIDFARAYQLGCPANGLNILIGVLSAVRTVIVDVALLLTTMLSMMFETLRLFLVTGRQEARALIGTNWAYIRNKARTILDTVGDLMVDTLLNSGAVGQRIMNFLLSACNGLNLAGDWFLNVWCNYIQRYTLQFLAGIRRFLGITGAGFDILQDFIDQIFQGVLPAAFISKYASGAFQNMLTEFYSSPTEKKSKANTMSNIPDSANPRQVSRTARAKSIITRVYGYGGRLVKGVMKASVYASAALAAYETVDTIRSIAEEEYLRTLYPENFTLFDLSDIMNVVDDMQDFIMSPLSQDTCVVYQLFKKADPSYKMFQCLNVNLDSYKSSAKGTTSIAATKCWANAVPSLGQNSMFACVGASTCCRTPECKDFILCATCAEPAYAGVYKYGCDSLRQSCTCALPETQYSRCAANRECDAQTDCELVSSLNSVSYGTIPCGQCPSTARVVCMLPKTGMPGRCSCMLAGAPSFDLCNDRSGSRTPVDSSRLCGYLHNRRDDMTKWAFDMEDLIVLPCAQVSTGICSDVLTPLGSIRMVVAETIRYSSSGRRLLLDSEQVVPDPGPPVYDAYESEYQLDDTAALHALLTDPGWNTTAAPCSTLVMAYQAGEKLGLLETHVLHKCGFWRYVGRRMILRYNLTEPMSGHETFLLSLDDLVYAAMSPEVAAALLQNPGVFFSALMYHPWMKPLRAAGLIAANHLEYLHWIKGIDLEVHDALFGDFTPEEQARQTALATRPPGPRIAPRNTSRNRHDGARNTTQAPAPVDRAGRRLLSVQDVLEYSARIIKSPDSTGQLPSRVYGAWSNAEFAWPLRYNYSATACPIAMSLLDIGIHVSKVNKMYYLNFEVVRAPTPKNLRGNLPNFEWVKDARPGKVPAPSSWASHVFRWMLALVGLEPRQLAAFFTSKGRWSLEWMVQSLTQCDLTTTLTCSLHDKDVLMSTVVFLLMFVTLYVTAGAMGLGFLPFLFLLSYPGFILWYAFGMPPTCFPMIPTCLLSDVLEAAETVFPRRIVFPHNLLCEGNKTDCLRPCSDLDFVNWVDPLAFAICDTDEALCGYLQGLGPSGLPPLDELVWTPARDAMRRFRTVIARGDLAGHRICAWVSFVTVIPILFALLCILLAASTIVGIAMDILPSLVAFLCHTFVFYES